MLRAVKYLLAFAFLGSINYSSLSIGTSFFFSLAGCMLRPRDPSYCIIQYFSVSISTLLTSFLSVCPGGHVHPGWISFLDATYVITASFMVGMFLLRIWENPVGVLGRCGIVRASFIFDRP